MAGARDIRAGNAYVELLLKKKGFLSALKAVRLDLISFAGIAKIATGIVGGISLAHAIKEAGTLEQTMSKFNTVFGDRAGAVQEWSDAYAAAIGRSREEVASFMAENQDLLVPLGFEPGAAEVMSKELTKLAYDLASFNNYEDADVMENLRSGLIGNGAALKKYGVILNETTMKQHMLKHGMKLETASEAQKALARMQIITEAASAAQDDATRTAGEFSNQYKGLWGEVSNLSASFGNLLLPAVTSVISKGREALAWGGQMIDMYGGEFTETLSYAADQTFDFIDNIIIYWGDLYTSISSVVGAFGTLFGEELGAAYATVSSYFTGMGNDTATTWTFMSSSAGGFLAWLQDTVIGTLSVVSFSFQNWQQVGEMALVSMGYSLVKFGNQAVYYLGTVVPEWLGWFGENWQDVFADIANYTSTVFSNMYKNIENFWHAIFSLLSGEEFNFEWTPLTAGFESAIKELPNIAEREIGALEQSLQDRLNSLADGVVNEFDKHQKKYNIDQFKSGAAPTLSGPGKDGKPAVSLDAGKRPAMQDLAAGRERASDTLVATYSAAGLQAAGRAGGGDTTQKEILTVLKKGNEEAERFRRAALASGIFVE